MRVRKFLIPLFIVAIIGFVVAQSCTSTGFFNSTHYCDAASGEVELLKTDGTACVNDFECANQSCADSFCQSKFGDEPIFKENYTGWLEDIWNLIQGIECDPENQSYHCKENDTHAYICGANAVYEDKGEIIGLCNATGVCGDGNLTIDEQCDDGNNWSNDSCKGDCTFNICGDNSTYVGVEECDDGNNVSGDGCNDYCVSEQCGTINVTNCSGFYNVTCNESYVWVFSNLTLGECGVECLPVGNVTCNVTQTLECNGSYVWENLGEINGSCGFPPYVCGNGAVEIPYEECDDNNTYSNDSCKGDCTWNVCGDGSIYLGVEECDDGNNVSGDGCNDLCLIEDCSTVNVTNCSGFYNITCNESYLWQPANLTIGECGVECLPLGNESCNGTSYLYCNSSYVWDDRGLVDGECGYARPHGGGGGGRSTRSPNIEIVFFSPMKDVTYSSNRIALQVADRNHKAEFWRYSLNRGKQLDFVPNTTIFPSEGHNSIIVYAREDFKSKKEEAKEVEFDVVIPSPTDRGYCGDNLCQETENCENCANDCGACPIIEEVFCGNEECDTEESSYSCPSDCIARERTDYTYVAAGVLAASLAVLGFVLYRRFFSGAAGILDPRGE